MIVYTTLAQTYTANSVGKSGTQMYRQGGRTQFKFLHNIMTAYLLLNNDFRLKLPLTTPVHITKIYSSRFRVAQCCRRSRYRN